MPRHRAIGVSFMPDDMRDLTTIQTFLRSRGHRIGRSQAVRYALRMAARDVRAVEAMSVR